ITTKQERFVKQILQANGIELDDERIFGLDRNKTKPEILTLLLQQQPTADIRFVEDRLPTLLNVQKEPALAKVQLIFALWGYNTADDKAHALQQLFVLQELPDFLR
ncbi:MAG: HAD family hydrolase, partial [Methylococcales bacterium]|nr:HAD family hydrolase [Methylococcales bacterium]